MTGVYIFIVGSLILGGVIGYLIGHEHGFKMGQDCYPIEEYEEPKK